MAFKYFTELSHAKTYGEFRPRPPASLINEIVNFLKRKIPKPLWAVDVGCGAGQSTVTLTPHFENVMGFDPSEDIVDVANKKYQELKNLTFKASGAEELQLEDNSVDLITTCQAAHWFDLSKFYPEVERVLKKDGVFAIYGYHLPEPVSGNGEGDASQIIRKYYEQVLGDYILPGSKQVYLKNYREPEFNRIPFVEGGNMIRYEGFVTEMSVTIRDVTGYISTWSGFQNFVQKQGKEAGEQLLTEFENELSGAMGEKAKGENILVQYRYFALLGRKVHG